jgi:hypothetical protein
MSNITIHLSRLRMGMDIADFLCGQVMASVREMEAHRLQSNAGIIVL